MFECHGSHQVAGSKQQVFNLSNSVFFKAASRASIPKELVPSMNVRVTAGSFHHRYVCAARLLRCFLEAVGLLES